MSMIDPSTDRRRVLWTVAAAVLLPVALILIGGTSRPELGYLLIAGVVLALWIIGQIRRARSYEDTDERARHLNRQAMAFSWYVTAVALAVAAGWASIRYGMHTGEPYVLLTITLIGSHAAALLWQRWRNA
jgi:hypothetical protein